jgi:exodeoxyribonuclease VII small subunit
MAKKQTPPRDFEEAMKELEQILGEIERGEVGLEQSLARYERGTFLIQHCQGILNAAEQQIQAITINQSGALRTSPLPAPEEPEPGTP